MVVEGLECFREVNLFLAIELWTEKQKTWPGEGVKGLRGGLNDTFFGHRTFC